MNIPKGVAITLGILFILSIILISNKNEGFTVVEDDIDKIITIQDGSLLSKINTKNEVVKNIWGCSEFGKEMKLC
jgi:fumarylacetoacetate (FAA) hydrolase family protein